MTGKYRITITEFCATCQGGTDRPFQQWCSECGRDFTTEELKNWGPFHYPPERADECTIPCGHDVVAFRESNWCPDCENEDWFVREVGLVEFARLLVEATDEMPS